MKTQWQFAAVLPSLTNAHKRARGFSLVELMIVISVGMIAIAIGFITLAPAMKQQDVAQAYDTTLAAMRQARDLAVTNRESTVVTFSNAAIPNTITTTIGETGAVVSTYTLPKDVSFTVVTGVPISKSVAPTTPDAMGTASRAIDFDQGVAGGNTSAIYFYPDGTGQDVNGNINNGVLYMAMPGNLYSSRAITLWGATGRLYGWRLHASGAQAAWSAQ